MYKTNEQKAEFIRGVMNLVLDDVVKIFNEANPPYAWVYEYTVSGEGPFENVALIKPEEGTVDGTHRFNIRPLYLG